MEKTSVGFLLWIVTIIVFSLVMGVTPLDLSIQPERGHLFMNGDILTITCRAFEPIKHCQFSFIKDEANWEGPLLDLSEGPRSPEDPNILNEALTGYEYVGSGLRDGVCGVKLRLKGWKRHIAGCRTRTSTGGWRYATMSFTADQSASIDVKVTPKTAVVLPGSDVNLLCKAVGILKWCRFDLPYRIPKHIFLDQGAQSRESTSKHRYFGAGLASGECGVTLSAVSEDETGFAWCGMVINGTYSWERTAIPVIVAKAPNAPVLNITSDILVAGQKMEATCTVTECRPAPNITWYLDDRVLRQDSLNDAADNKWGWPTSIHTYMQRVKHSLVAADDGRQLKCVVTHMTLREPLVATQTLHLATNLCSPLKSESVVITCTLGAESFDCNKHVPSGTIALLNCKTGFKKPDHVYYNKISCSSGGVWNRPVFNCTPDCGKRKTNSGVKLLAGGTDASVGEFPWHIGIYQKINGVFKHICAGTLITTNTIISAAHCFWHSQLERKIPTSEFKVAAGKHLRAWDDPNENFQKRNVEDIRLKASFRGRINNFASDIAIVQISTAFEITSFVNLACVDWENTMESWQLVTGSKGIVAGWGYTLQGVPSDSLQYVELPFVSVPQCLESLTRDLLPLLTSDKFCAGWINNSTSVCPGDSGGGLVFHHPGSNRHYLRGIVSIAFAPASNREVCFAQHYTAFTQLSQFIPWIQDNLL